MHVHTVRVKFTREKQPKDYEKSAPDLEFGATLDEGEDHLAAARRLMADACGVAYAALGYDTPPKVLAKLGGGEVPEGGTVEAAPAEKPKRAPRKTAAQKKAEEAVAEVNRAVSTTPEDRRNPEDDVVDETAPAEAPAAAGTASADDVPGAEDDTVQGAPTAGDLNAYVTQVISSKQIDVNRVKEILAAHAASRISEVKAADFQKVMDAIKADIEAKELVS